MDVAGTEAVEQREPSIVGDGGNTARGLERQDTKFALCPIWDRKPLTFLIGV